MFRQGNVIHRHKLGRAFIYVFLLVLCGTAFLRLTCKNAFICKSQDPTSSIFEKENSNTPLENRYKDKTNVSSSHVSNKNKELIDDDPIKILTKDLQNKLENVIPTAETEIQPTCKTEKSIAKSCDEKTGCLRLGLPNSMTSRIEQIVTPRHLHYGDDYKRVFEDMANSVPGYYDIVLVTGASSNHYMESKALLYNLKKFVYPHLKNFTVIYYDIGLSYAQRRDISQVCQCHVRLFPFSRFPKNFSTLKCYAWKPMIVNAHASRGNLVHWLDASIRFSADFSKLETLYSRARAYGMQAGCIGSPLTRITLPSMFHFFGDEACSYHPYRDLTAGFVIFHNEPLMQAILTAWSACALDEGCMCPHKQVDIKKFFDCPKPYDIVDEYAYGVCHRFDQAALAIIIRKLFQEKSSHLLRMDILKYVDIKRDDKFLVM